MHHIFLLLEVFLLFIISFGACSVRIPPWIRWSLVFKYFDVYFQMFFYFWKWFFGSFSVSLIRKWCQTILSTGKIRWIAEWKRHFFGNHTTKQITCNRIVLVFRWNLGEWYFSTKKKKNFRLTIYYYILMFGRMFSFFVGDLLSA